MRKRIKKGLSLLLALSMVMSILNLAVFAADGQGAEHTHNEGGWSCIQAEGAKTLKCESEEHTHDEGCYEVTTRRELRCTLEEAEATEGHQHTEACYDTEGGLSCSLEETEATEGHQHGEDCYESVEEKKLTCEKEEHTHTEECYTLTEGTWSCTEPTQTPEPTQTSEPTQTPEATQVPEPVETLEPMQSTAAGMMRLRAAMPEDSGDKDGDGLAVEVKAVEGIEAVRFDVTITGSGTLGIDTKVDASPDFSLGSYNSGGSKWRSVTVSGEITIPKENPFIASDTLETVTLTGNVSVESNAFYDCSALKTVTLTGPEEGWLTVGERAFFDCPALETVTLERVKCSSANDDPFSLYDKNDTVMTVTAKDCDLAGMFCNSNVKSAAITGGTVGSRAFNSAEGLTNVTLSGVTEIGQTAFAYCQALTELSLPAVITVGDNAFNGCSALTEIDLPAAEQVGYKAFSGCAALTELSLPAVKEVDRNAFQSCTALKTVTLGSEDHDMTFTDTGTGAFTGCGALETLALNRATVPQSAKLFKDDTTGKNAANGVTVIFNGGSIGYQTFYKCSNLKTVVMNNVEKVEGSAFYDCKNLHNVEVNGVTHLGYNAGYTDVSERMQAIMAGKFKLDPTPGIVDITGNIPEEGWDDPKLADHKTAQSANWEGYDNGTQLVEQAKWINADKTKAQVKVDAYYTGEKQMDYIFVADLSASMAYLGNAKDQNGKVYDMQSKLLDMAGQLLNADDGYDCRVAIVTFGSKKATVGNTGFLTDAETVKEKINGLVPLLENTDYGLGMQEAQRLAEGNTSRNTVVVFLSDGKPNSKESGDMDGSKAAAVIQTLDNPDGSKVPIYGVLHSPGTGAAYTNAKTAMEKVCSEIPGTQTMFESTDTKSFGEAMNKAFSAVYGTRTVTIPVNEAFKPVSGEELEVNPGAGEAQVSPDGKTITWIITGMPFTKHTLTYSMDLTDENAAKTGEQKYPVNSGNGYFGNDGGASVESPVLTRACYKLTVNYVYEKEDGETAAPSVEQVLFEGDKYTVTSPVIEGYTTDRTVVEGAMPDKDVVETVVYRKKAAPPVDPGPSGGDDDDDDDDDPPAVSPTPSPTPSESPMPSESPVPSETPAPTESPAPMEELNDPDVPLTEQPTEAESAETEDMDDEDVPLAEVPQTGDKGLAWLILAFLSATGLAGITVVEKKRKV